MSLTAQSLTQDDADVVAGSKTRAGDLELKIQGAVINRNNASMQASGQLMLEAGGRLVNGEGARLVGDSVSLKTTGASDNAGLVYAKRTLTVKAKGGVTNQAAPKSASTSAPTQTATQPATQTGDDEGALLYGGDGVSVTAGGTLVNGKGARIVGGNVALDAQALRNEGGTLRAGIAGAPVATGTSATPGAANALSLIHI